MRQLSEVEHEQRAMATLVGLTSVFEGIASMRIAQIKNQVMQATQFFHELWHIYSQLRVDSQFRFGRSQEGAAAIDKDLYIVITAEGGFSGDIDIKLIELMLKTYNKDQHDIIVIGHHGAIQLAQRGISYKKFFKLPVQDQNINVTPIIKEVQSYRSTTVFYQEYVSLLVQEVRNIELLAVVQQDSKDAGAQDEVISEATYIFEPSTYAVIDHLERSMLHIAMSQLILDSKLAQYASRFRAMSASHQKATETRDDLKMTYNRTKRALKDERLKEVVNGLRHKEAVT
jgi:F-type H+-transporting ATPase subunit gamma